ncbi:UNVERIFIED_CONTAM: hypothetical protein GTU68_038645 [Idotea baltica]|nr:hypothetical protein [Idotea baltica]
MDITEVRVKLVSDEESRLQAFCSITFDREFVVRDLKVIDGPKGAFVAMPSRRLTNRLFADIAHPINSAARLKIHKHVMDAVAEERIKAQQPGYVCSYDEADQDSVVSS